MIRAMAGMIFLFLAVGIQGKAIAGDFPQGIGLEAWVQYGFIIRHHVDFDPYNNFPFTAF